MTQSYCSKRDTGVTAVTDARQNWMNPA